MLSAKRRKLSLPLSLCAPTTENPKKRMGKMQGFDNNVRAGKGIKRVQNLAKEENKTQPSPCVLTMTVSFVGPTPLIVRAAMEILYNLNMFSPSMTVLLFWFLTKVSTLPWSVNTSLAFASRKYSVKPWR